jgi:chromosome partitioning protein
MARKIAITLRKGGSGKTTTAVNLAAALHQKGQRVLLVDLDPQANATIALGINPLELDYNVNHLFTTLDVGPREVLTKTAFGMDLLPSHPDLAQTEAGMTATQVGTLRGLLTPYEPDYDFIIIDTPPSESYLTANVLVYVDEVIIPLQVHFLALQGLAQALESIDKVRVGLNPDIRVRGILPTFVQRTNIAKKVLEEIKIEYPRLLYPYGVDHSVRHVEASLLGVPVVIADPAHQGAIAYNQLAEDLLS